MKKEKDEKKHGGKTDIPCDVEDSTLYDEFIPSFFSWIPPKRQKEKSEELAKKIE